MLTDEKVAILQYEEKLLRGKKKATANTYTGDVDTCDRLALAVFRHVIETILQWSPEEAFSNMSMTLIRNLNLNNEWNNLDLPREVRQYNTAKYVIARLYPKKYMRMFSKEALTIQVYRSVLEQRRGVFPKNYFLEADGEIRAIICLRFMLNTYVRYRDVESMYKDFSNTDMIMKILHEYGLKYACKTLFSSPLEYLHAALPKVQKSELWYNYYKFLQDKEKMESDKPVKKRKYTKKR